MLFLDVVHTAREVGSFKTRHLYPPPNFYDRAANLAGAVVVGSCRIGATNEVDQDVLRREAADIWDAQAREGDGGGDEGGKGRRGDSGGGGDNHSRATGSDSRSSESGSGSDNTSGGSITSDESTRGDDFGSTGDEDGSDNSDVTDASSSNSSKDRSIDNSASRREEDVSDKGIGNGRAESGNSSGTGSGPRDRDRRRQRRSGNGIGIDGDTRRKSQRGQASKRSLVRGHSGRLRSGSRVRRGKNEAGTARPPSSSRLFRQLSGGLGEKSPGDFGDGSGDGSEQATRPCAPVYDRAIYEEKMSVFGRAVRNALGGECTEKGHVHRVLLVDLFKFIRREFRSFERPRELMVMPATEEGRGSGSGGEEDRGAAKKNRTTAAEAKAKKEAAKKEARRRPKPGSRAEGLRQEKEAARLEEEKDELRRRTQVLELRILTFACSTGVSELWI